jgi:hypothetical protein
MRGYIEYWLERQLKQDVDKRRQAVAIIPAAMEDILETAVVGDINKMTTTRKIDKGFICALTISLLIPSFFVYQPSYSSFLNTFE